MIPDEAIEAAAKVLRAQDDKLTYPYPVLEYMDDAKSILEAAAPFIRAVALSGAAEEFEARLPDGTGNGRAYNSYAVARILRERAARPYIAGTAQ